MAVRDRQQPDGAGDRSADPETRTVGEYWAEKAPHWTGWAPRIADFADRFNTPFLEAIAPAPGHVMLDLASGAGEPALSARTRVGPGGLVIATDLVPEMLAGLRSRTSEDPIPSAAADMQRLPFPDSAFDRVSCRFGIMFVPAPSRALADVLRVLRPGGRCGFLVWGPREDNLLFRVLAGAVEEVLGHAPDAHHHAIFSFGEAGRLAAAMEAAGLENVEETPLHFRPEMPADEPFWQPQLEMGFGPQVAQADAETRRRLDAAIAERLDETREGDVWRLYAHIRVATGDKPH